MDNGPSVNGPLYTSASFRQAVLVDALFETSYLDKPPHHVKVGFIEGVSFSYHYLHKLLR